DQIPEDFIALANGNQVDALIIYEAGAQLFYEAQVCLLWVMYNCFSTTGGMVDAATAESATSLDRNDGNSRSATK
ncbi:MAG TPA: hypothetical protein VG963_13215, partial [Polyangiaceae bacterium]|nr:hypothetical protein [Polyangiaceae bacterium]